MLEKINYPCDLKDLSLEELQELGSEIREFLVETVTRTGGHLSPNLGIVEITLALHTVFNTPEDSIIWDVGHQSYVHKILTGRKECFSGLRLKEGLSGFPSPGESGHDAVHAGHSSTSVSIAAGIAQAKRLQNDTSATIAVIGDGAFTGGMVYEALNTIAHEQLPVIMILNDNGMSISQNVGGISRYLKDLQSSKSYLSLKKRIETLFKKQLPAKAGRQILGIMYRIKEMLKTALIQRNFFEDMGISYYGPMDGHHLRHLIETFKEVKDLDKPIIIHALTQKGRGHGPAEENPGHYHGISGMPDKTETAQPAGESFSQVFGSTLCRLAAADEKIFAITAAMTSGTGLKQFSLDYPRRFADVGIAEEHAVDFALGLSLRGFKPVVAIYSTFLQRSFDQLIHDIGISRARVLFCLDRAGLVPGDGETHQGIFDLSFLRMIPHFTVLAPATGRELSLMMQQTLVDLQGPVVIRYPKDEAGEVEGYDPALFPLAKGLAVKVRDGADAVIVSIGTHLKTAMAAAAGLSAQGIEAEVQHLRAVKPLEDSFVINLTASDRPVLFLEEGVEIGSVSQHLAYLCALKNPGRRLVINALPDGFPGVATRAELLNQYNFTKEWVIRTIKEMKEA